MSDAVQHRIQLAREKGVPEHLCEGLAEYVERGLRPGGFLTAALENDLVQSFARGDEWSVAGMRNICEFLYWCIPLVARGSPEKVERWIKLGGIEGIARAETTAASEEKS